MATDTPSNAVEAWLDDVCEQLERLQVLVMERSYGETHTDMLRHLERMAGSIDTATDAVRGASATASAYLPPGFMDEVVLTPGGRVPTTG